jgi:HEAT repeat protein
VKPLRALAVTDEERKRTERISGVAAVGAAAVDELATQLDDPSWVVRRAVVAALAKIGEPAVARLCAILVDHRESEARLAATVDTLVASRGDVDAAALRLTESPMAPVVCDALQILGRRQSTGAVPRIGALVLHPDDNVALAAIEALGRIGDDAALAPLIATVEQRSFFRAFPAIDVLGRSGSLRAVKPLLALLDDRHYGIEAARGLGRIGDPSAIVPLVALLAKPSDAIVRTAAAAIGEIHDRQVERFGTTGLVSLALGRADHPSAINRVIQALRHADAAEQGALVRILGWMGGEGAAVALVDLLGGDSGTSDTAAAALGRLGKEAQPHLLLALQGAGSERRLKLLPLLSHKIEAAGPIAECLTDPSATVRALACDALARVGETSGIVPRLFLLLGDPDARVTQSAVAAIQSLGSPETERLALEAARSGELRVRRAGLRIIAYFGYLSAIDVLIEAMDDPDERIRDAAIFGLPFIEDPRATDALLRAASHASPRTRAAAMRAIGQATKQPRTITSLRTGLHDADAWVRYFACQALSRLKDEGSAEMIATLFADPAGQVRVAVVEALAQLRGAHALEALHRAAVGADPDVQRAALLGLGHVKDPASLPVLRQALGGADSSTRLVAVSALAEYPLPEIASDLGVALSDADDGVRNAAVALLASRPGPEATRTLVAQLGSRPIQERIVAALAQPAAGRVEVLAEALRGATAETAPLIVATLARSHRGEALLVLEEGFALHGVTVRRAIAQALAAMGMETSSSRSLLVQAATEDPDDEVRQIAADATAR